MEQQKINDLIERLVAQRMERMYEEFDRLHDSGINDTQVEAALKALGYDSIAEDYIEWQNDGEPVEAVEEDCAPRGIVPDPIDSPSYEAIPESKDRIDRHGFYAEPAVDGKGWFVYKKRNGDDAGGLIGKWHTKQRTITILNSLAEGRTNV